MGSNIVTAVLIKGVISKTRAIFQYDYGIVLRLVGKELPPAYEVHFSTDRHSVACTQIGGPDGVAIPDSFLRSRGNIYAWLFLHTGDSDGETEFTIQIPVIGRSDIDPEHPTSEQRDAFTQGIAALNAGVQHVDEALNQIVTMVEDAAGRLKQGPPGVSPSVTVTPYAQQDGNGYTVRIIDAYGEKSFVLLHGKNGLPGQDGTSVTCSVDTIPGGHRVTLTDVYGNHTYDVMDEAAETSATLAESFTKGGTNTRTGENTDNAKYYKEQAASSATTASNKANEATTARNQAVAAHDEIFDILNNATILDTTETVTLNADNLVAQIVHTSNATGLVVRTDVFTYSENNAVVTEVRTAADGRTQTNIYNLDTLEQRFNV